MKKLFLLLLIGCFSEISFARMNCDITCFHWDCDIAVQTKPTKSNLSSIHCGRTVLWITQAQYDTLARYRRADINMVLNIDNEYIDSPCVLGER